LERNARVRRRAGGARYRRASARGDRSGAILSVSYHATLLREDSRPVTFRLALSEPAFLPPQETAEPESRVDAAFAPVLAGHVLRRVRATVRAAQHGGTLILIPRARVSEF